MSPRLKLPLHWRLQTELPGISSSTQENFGSVTAMKREFEVGPAKRLLGLLGHSTLAPKLRTPADLTIWTVQKTPDGVT